MVWNAPPNAEFRGGPASCVYDATGTKLVAWRSCSDVGYETCPNRDRGGFCKDGGVAYAQLALCDFMTLERRCGFDGKDIAAQTCTQPLEAAGEACAPTFAEQEVRAVTCGANRFTTVATCGAKRVWTETGPYPKRQCFYGDDGRLATALICSNVSATCQKTCVHAGAVSDWAATCTFTESSNDRPGCKQAE
jgi:hypothetical protein